MGRCAGLAVLTITVVAGACSSDDGPSTAYGAGDPDVRDTSARNDERAGIERSTGGDATPYHPADVARYGPGDLPRGRVDEHRINDRRIDRPGSLPPPRCPRTGRGVGRRRARGPRQRDRGLLAAQQILIGQLAQFAQPADPTLEGDDGFRQVFSSGTNLLGVIPGGDLADEWVVLGAHYDHLGTDCRIDDPADSICNGATDNATGVAVALGSARAIATAGTPRRSVLVALWDAEEDGLIGSAAYLQGPHAPAMQTIAYLNFDNQGSNLLPSSADRTVMVGAETGGAALVDAATTATAASKLQTASLSLVFGQGRSDHANFVAAGVPSGAAVTDPLDVPGVEEPGQPSPRGRVHPRPVAVRVHQRVQRRGLAAAL